MLLRPSWKAIYHLSQILKLLIFHREDSIDSRKAQQITLTGKNILTKEGNILSRHQPLTNGARHYSAW
jgi:hypothetical protein